MKKYLKRTLLFFLFSPLTACVADEGTSKQSVPVIDAKMHNTSPAQPLDAAAGERVLTLIALMLMSAEEDGHNQLHEMQRDLPKILSLSKNYRQCLQMAESQKAANVCQQNGWIEAKAQNIDDESFDLPLSDDISNWTEKKTAYLQNLDADLAPWDQALPCILNAQIPVQIAECLELNKQAEQN